MLRLFGTRPQTALIVVLFLGSLCALLFNILSPLRLPRREHQVRDRLREAGGRLAREAAPIAEALPRGPGPDLDEVGRRLREVTQGVLADYPGVEGGFYLGGDLDRFSGFAFPTGLPGPNPPGSGPPPIEAPFILEQARRSLDLQPGDFRAETREAGPSRVVVLTEPIGPGPPARLAVWVMCRLTGPEQLEGQVRVYQVSAGLALGGIVLALGLTWHLGRVLRRQRWEEERLRDELRRAEHLAALGTLLAGVAHEVRNPLAAIRSTVQLWQRLPDRARTPGSLEAVVGAVDRLDALVGRLLHFSRADRGERETVDLNRILGEGLALVQAQAEGQGVTVERDLDPGLPPVAGSANALRQVVLNLLTNALQAMPRGGTLRCGTRPRPRSSTVELWVADTGPGISAEDRRHLFEPFFTTRPDGTGLGLALCREIVLGHGGRLELDSSSASGTTFLVGLPAGTVER